MPVSKIGTNALSSGLDVSSTNISYTGTLTGGTGVVNIGSGQVYKDASGNVGIGVTPSAWSGGYVGFQVKDAAFASFSSGYTWVGNNWYNNSGNKYIANGTATLYEQNGGAHKWFYAASGTAGNAISFTQAMTLDSSGNLLVGTTNPSVSAGPGFKYVADASNPYTGSVVTATSGVNTYHLYSTGAAAYRFYVSSAGQINATNTSIAGISDASLKENIRDLETGLAQIMALKPRRFDWKNGDAKNVAGFVAQEVEPILPELVCDYVYNKDEDGNDIVKKSLKMGDMLPTLVKAIQELKAELDSVKAELAVLKGV